MGTDKHKKHIPLLDSGLLVLISSFLFSSFSSPSRYVSTWSLHHFTGHLHPRSSMIFVNYYSFNNPIYPARATPAHYVSFCPPTSSFKSGLFGSIVILYHIKQIISRHCCPVFPSILPFLSMGSSDRLSFGPEFLTGVNRIPRIMTAKFRICNEMEIW